MATTCQPVPRLPIEVIEHIIDLVGELYYDYDDLYPRDLYPIWKACALTCRAMAPRSQYWLFREIFLNKESQANSLVRLLRRNPKIGENSLALTIWGPIGEESRQHSTWMSWIPHILAPRMKNIQELYLYNDVLSDSHPTFPMALTAFKSVRRLELYGVRFSTFGHCSRLIRAFPRLDYLRCLYLWWDVPFTKLQSPIKHTPRSLHVIHLDLWANYVDSDELVEFAEWFVRLQPENSLRTLSFNSEGGTNRDSMLDVVRYCGANARSIFLEFSEDAPISGFNSCTYLETIHLQSDDHQFPTQTITSILSVSFRQLRRIIVYIKASVEGGTIKQHDANEVEAYRRLDEALSSNQQLRGVVLIVRIFRSDSANDVAPWQQRLPTLLPKFCALGRFGVERTRREHPISIWSETRDGF